MNLKELIKSVSERTDGTQVMVGCIIRRAITEITRSLKSGQDVSIAGLARFQIQDKPARTGRNPATGQSVEIKARRVVKIKPSKTLSDCVDTGGR